MKRRIGGWDAIEFAERTGRPLKKYGDPIEKERSGLTVREAREIALEDSGLIFIDVKA